MVPLGLVLVGFGLWAFFWAVGSGQFDDLDSPGWSVLDDEKKQRAQSAAGDDASAAAAAPPANDAGEERK
jgi:cbb3-type cytochrome oxidase maturation protein